MLHFRYGCEPLAPWRGISPLDRARIDRDILGWLKERVRQEASRPTGTLFGVSGPGNHFAPSEQDEMERTKIGESAAGRPPGRCRRDNAGPHPAAPRRG